MKVKWAAILLIFPSIFEIVYAIELALGRKMPGIEPLKAYLENPAILPLVAQLGLGSGPISEEPGWRGGALDSLMKSFGRIPGTIILGLFFMPQTWHGQMGMMLGRRAGVVPGNGYNKVESF